MRKITYVLLLYMLFLLLAACSPGRSHRNFISVMETEVGDSEREHSYRIKRRDRLVGTRQLENGNVEEAFVVGYGLRCRVYFEVDRANKRVVSWRFEGDKKDCAINP
jgi:hypothetical protein